MRSCALCQTGPLGVATQVPTRTCQSKGYSLRCKMARCPVNPGPSAPQRAGPAPEPSCVPRGLGRVLFEATGPIRAGEGGGGLGSQPESPGAWQRQVPVPLGTPSELGACSPEAHGRTVADRHATSTCHSNHRSVAGLRRPFRTTNTHHHDSWRVEFSGCGDFKFEGRVNGSRISVSEAQELVDDVVQRH